MDVSLALDILLVGLLVATIVYAAALNRRLERLRRDGEALKAVLGGFEEAASRTGEGLARLKALGESLQHRVEEARGLHDDLSYLVERGEDVAGRLGEAGRGARPAPAARPPRDLVEALRHAR